MRHANLQVGGIASQHPIAEAAEDLALVEALAVAHAVGQLHLVAEILHVDGAHQAALAEHRVRLNEPQFAEHRHRTGGRRGAHGE